MIMSEYADLAILAGKIQAVDFDHVFRVTDTDVVDVPGQYAPDVTNDPDGDVEVGRGWQCLTGMTGQYGYSGAVMHPSEYIGEGIARRMREMAWQAEQDGHALAFAVVEVRDDDGSFPDGDPIGWAIAYRTV